MLQNVTVEHEPADLFRGVEAHNEEHAWTDVWYRYGVVPANGL